MRPSTNVSAGAVLRWMVASSALPAAMESARLEEDAGCAQGFRPWRPGSVFVRITRGAD